MDIETDYKIALFNKQFKDKREKFERRLAMGDLPLNIILDEYTKRTGKHFVKKTKEDLTTCKQISKGTLRLNLKDIKRVLF
jgi:hypothetical protein